jgi:glycosyltransferase involved in cell wall biosynthesis
MKKVSIIIPTYNRSHFLGETLDSILAQGYQNWECIVVDDSSTDYTSELMQSYCELDERIKFFKRPKDRQKGANSCRNYGFELSNGEYTNWFDSDDLMLPNFLEDAFSCFHNFPSLDLVIADYDIFSDEDKKVFHRQRNEIQYLEQDYFTGKINFGCPHIIWNRSVIKDFKYKQHLTRAQELDFHFQIFSSLSLQWHQLKGAYVLVRRHNASLTSDFQEGKYESLKSELEVRRKILKFLKNQEYDYRILKPAMGIYISTFRKFCKKFTIQETKKELQILKEILGFRPAYKKWKLSLYLFLIIYKTTGREFRLKLHLKKLPEIFYGSK